MTDSEEPRVTTTEPNGWEMKRALESLSASVRDGFTQTNARLDRLVSQEAFVSEQRRVDDRITGLAEMLASEKADRVRADEEEKREREAGDTKQQAQLDKFAGNFRWLFASMVIPIACVILAWVLARGGAR